MNSSDFRSIARSKLAGKWGKAVCISLAYLLIAFVISLVERFFEETSFESIISLAFAIIEVPISFGLMIAFVKLFRDETVEAFDFLALGFQHFSRAWTIALNTFLKMILPVILLIISIILLSVSIFQASTSSVFSSSTAATSSGTSILGFFAIVLMIVSSIWTIIRSYSFAMSQLIAIDNPNMSSKDAVLKSQEIMTGNKGKLFVLQLSFIGWSILALFTFGIGSLWLLPYLQFATIAFYHHLVGKDNTTAQQPVVENLENNNI